MFKVQGTISDRHILYLDIDDDLNEFGQIELHSWVTFIIADDIDHPLLERFAELSIDKNLIYMAATGNACSQVDDLFDNVILRRELNGQQLPDWFKSEDDVLMTTWHHDFAEAFWYLTTAAHYGNIPIHTVFVANFTAVNRFDEIQDLTNKIKAGWLPSD